MPDAHPPDQLEHAVASVPPGRWAVGVSGGADSVALLSLLRDRPGLHLHVAHLDHQTRGEASTGDAAFVTALAQACGLPYTVALRADLESRVMDLPANPSSRFRTLRLALFREIAASHALDGVLLAHHADDQAETVLSRLLRGSGYAGLAGMSERAMLGGLTVVRPLLPIRRDTLRAYLAQRHQRWREDASNASDAYQRNRLRRLLADHPSLTDRLLHLSDRCRALRDWAHRTAPLLANEFRLIRLAALPPLLANESARRWLLARGVPPEDLSRSPAAVDRLIQMATDAAAPARRHFPGGVLARRRGGTISS